MTDTQQTAATTRLSTPVLWGPIIVIVVGVLVAIPGLVGVGVSFWDAVFGDTYHVPAVLHVHLEEGDHQIFENTTESRADAPEATAGNRLLITHANVTVTSPDGEPIRIWETDHNTLRTRGTSQYWSTVEFHAPRAGTYVVRVDPLAPTSVMIVGPFEPKVAAWFALSALGELVALAGVVWLVVAAQRRSRERRPCARRGGHCVDAACELVRRPGREPSSPLLGRCPSGRSTSPIEPTVRR